MSFKLLLMEMASVVFAVLLALGLNAWRENHKNEQLAEQAYENILTELRQNAVELDSGILDFEIRLTVLKTIEDSLERGHEVQKFYFGYSQPVLNKTAWSTANLTQAIVYMDPEVVMDISQLYIVQDVFNEFGFGYFSKMTDPYMQMDENVLARTRSNLMQIGIAEQLGRSLLSAYQEFFELYGLSIELEQSSP
ncbi:MAG: hypothetical protein RJQ09_11320 [Cyclobacteriaceae bacterium]